MSATHFITICLIVGEYLTRHQTDINILHRWVDTVWCYVCLHEHSMHTDTRPECPSKRTDWMSNVPPKGLTEWSSKRADWMCLKNGWLNAPQEELTQWPPLGRLNVPQKGQSICFSKRADGMSPQKGKLNVHQKGQSECPPPKGLSECPSKRLTESVKKGRWNVPLKGITECPSKGRLNVPQKG